MIDSLYKPCALDLIDFMILAACKHATSVQSLCTYLQSSFSEKSPDLTHEALLKRVQRRVYKLNGAGFLQASNPKEKPILYLSTPLALDLFSCAGNSNSCPKSSNMIPIRCSSERREAIQHVRAVKQLSKDHASTCQELFNYYLSLCSDKVCILESLAMVRAKNPDMNRYIILPYKTRFNDPEAQRRNLWIFNKIWDAATLQYKRAVHLILTTDPKRFKNLWEANRHFSKAFNRFMSYLTKYRGARPRYFAAYEYTKSGLLHAHLIIFGLPYLLPHHVITTEWERCNQGSYNYIYSLVNNAGQWNYARGKPKHVKEGDTVRSYLIKYLKKGNEEPERLFLYWIFNKRFFTYSRALYKDDCPPKEGQPFYRFLMSCFTWDLPDAIFHEPHFFKDRGPPL